MIWTCFKHEISNIFLLSFALLPQNIIDQILTFLQKKKFGKFDEMQMSGFAQLGKVGGGGGA